MARNRPKGVLELGFACFYCAATGRKEHVPTSEDYPDHQVRRVSFAAGGGHGWRISALITPREKPAAWKIVVITGSPSWAEYWAPAMAILPEDREMVVVDRPGFANSEPGEPVRDIRVQAEALAPLLEVKPGQKLLLVGQSYGAAIATLMAQARPWRVDALALISGYFGEPGPTARWLLETGANLLPVLPPDLRHAIVEVTGQPEQLHHALAALPKLNMPVHLIHGDADDFAPLETAQRLARELKMRRRLRFATVAGANHFLNDGPAEDLLAALEACIPPRRALSMPSLGVGLPRIAPSALPDLRWPDLGLRGRTGSPIPA